MTTLAPTAGCLPQVKWLPGCMQRTTRAESSGTCKIIMYNVRIDLNYLSRCLGRKPGTLEPQEAVAGSGWKQEVAAHRIDRATSKCVGATADAVPALGLGLRREESNFGHAASSDQTCHTSASSESTSESSHAPLEICDGPCYASRSNASEPDVRLDGVSKIM